MKTFIKVKLEVEGIHRWPAAADFDHQISFLSYPHRHIFHIMVVQPVSHDDRDIEIIKFKRELQAYFKRNYWNDNLNMCDFRSMSCEAIARDIMEAYGSEGVEVLEDNENGAICLK